MKRSVVRQLFHDYFDGYSKNDNDNYYAIIRLLYSPRQGGSNGGQIIKNGFFYQYY
jgi:hypothetical protein